MRNSVGTASEEKRSLGIRIGKSPTLKMTNISGTETEFNSLDSEKITGLVFSKIGYLIKNNKTDILDRRFEFIKKYTGRKQ